MTSARKLTVIMFTDIQGYTALMNKDEDNALQLLRKSRTIQLDQIEAFNGKLWKEMGDGILAEFRSAKDAVQCAIAIQKRSHEELDAAIRIGIHLGDVTIENNDIFGDGVNIASRLQNAADPGGIYISDSVYKAIKSIPEIETTYLGELEFKNVEDPVATFAIQGDVLPTPHIDLAENRQQRSKKRFIAIVSILTILVLTLWYFGIYQRDNSGPLVKSLAVLPFDDLTNTKDADIYIAGMHDALISELGRIQDLRVISKTSTLRFKDSELSLVEMANQLGVDSFIETSVFQVDSLVRLQVKLIGVYPEERTLWSNAITRDFTHIMEIYRFIANSIVEEVQLAVLPETRTRLQESVIINPKAYTSYLNARYYLGSLSEEGMNRALDYFRASILEDPNYAPAYGGMASVWAYRQQMGFASREEAVPAIEKNLNKALALDPALAESYYSKAVIEAWTNWNWLEAEKSFQEALAINPNLAEAHAFYSHLLMCLKRPVEMKLHMDQAIEIDPYNPLILVLNGIELSISGQNEEAIAQFEPLEKLAPNNPLVQIGMWWAYNSMGDDQNAYGKQMKILELVSKDQEVVNRFEEIFQTDGYKPALKAAADLWTQKAGEEFVPPDNIYWMYSAADDLENTLKWLEIGYETHDSNMPYIAVLPTLQKLQDNPQYLDLLARLNLPRN